MASFESITEKGEQMEFTCEAIGMDQAELQERVVQGLVTRILGTESVDEYGDAIRSKVMKEVNAHVEDSINKAIEKIADEHVYPMAEKLVTDHIFRQTNQWGESKGEPRTFVEYLAAKATEYFTEPVNEKGKAKSECYPHDRWSSVGPRVNFMISKTVADQIRASLQDAVKNIHVSLAEGLAETARETLAKVTEAAKIKVETK